MSAPKKIFYKGRANDFAIFIENSDLVDKYKKGDTTLPLIDIVSIYKVFINRQGGSEGMLDEASKQELTNEFGKADVDDIIKKILNEGDDKHGAGLGKSHGDRNQSDGAGATGN